MAEDRNKPRIHFPCQRLNPSETCPELKQAWYQILDLLEKVDLSSDTSLSQALGFIQSQGLTQAYKEYCKEPQS